MIQGGFALAQDAPAYGGQAVIEGVVMRGPKYVSLSVRKPEGGVASMIKRALSPSQKSAFMRLPVARGAFAFWDSLSLGVEMLAKSAEIAAPDEARPSRTAVDLGVAVGLIVAIGLFILLPAAATPYLMTVLRIHGRFLSSLAETSLRLVILFAYIGLVFRMREIQRVLEYHGAEHKVIWAWEKGYRDIMERVRQEKWDAADVAEYLAGKAKGESRLHPRCGTSFLFIVVLCTWVVFLFVTPPGMLARVGIRLLLLPFAAGMSYEVLKVSADKDNALWKLVRAPGMALQRLTTREPDEGELEVAADSLVHLAEAERGAFR
jgi:uncharacterized protein YqhQ